MTIPLTAPDIGVVRKGGRFKPSPLGADYIFVIPPRHVQLVLLTARRFLRLEERFLVAHRLGDRAPGPGLSSQ